MISTEVSCELISHEVLEQEWPSRIFPVSGRDKTLSFHMNESLGMGSPSEAQPQAGDSLTARSMPGKGLSCLPSAAPTLGSWENKHLAPEKAANDSIYSTPLIFMTNL